MVKKVGRTKKRVLKASSQIKKGKGKGKRIRENKGKIYRVIHCPNHREYFIE